jgi:NADPH-dependent curcumin reductase CurA
MTQQIILKSRPVGVPTPENFETRLVTIPTITNGMIRLKAHLFSVDPYLRGRMSDAKSYVPPFTIGEPIVGGGIAQVIESQDSGFKKGDFVIGMIPWQEEMVVEASGLKVVDDKIAPLSYYLGILGMPGLTAYFGLLDIGKPKKGETVVVSGAAGAVGIAVGQIAKIQGCRVVGIAGDDSKVDYLKNKLHFDEVINYKTIPNLNQAITSACPDGVDVYFDNVGGEISDAVLMNINKHARLPICGAISLYNNNKISLGPRLQPILLTKSATMRGFIVSDFSAKFHAAMKQLAIWLKDGKLTYSETIVEGFDNIPQAFIDLFDGKNEGKMIVKI